MIWLNIDIWRHKLTSYLCLFSSNNRISADMYLNISEMLVWMRSIFFVYDFRFSATVLGGSAITINFWNVYTEKGRRERGNVREKKKKNRNKSCNGDGTHKKPISLVTYMSSCRRQWLTKPASESIDMAERGTSRFGCARPASSGRNDMCERKRSGSVAITII